MEIKIKLLADNDQKEQVTSSFSDFDEAIQYLKSAQYEFEARADHLTGGDDE